MHTEERDQEESVIVRALHFSLIGLFSDSMPRTVSSATWQVHLSLKPGTLAGVAKRRKILEVFPLKHCWSV